MSSFFPVIRVVTDTLISGPLHFSLSAGHVPGFAFIFRNVIAWCLWRTLFFPASPFLTHPGAVLRNESRHWLQSPITVLPSKCLSRKSYYSFHGCLNLSGTLSPATVGFYLAAVRSLHLHLSLFDPTQNAQRRRRVMKGYSALWWISKLASSPASIGNSARDLPLVKHDFIA